MAGTINTSKTLHNSYLDGDKIDMTFNNNAPMQVNPVMYDQYDYAVTDNQELLNERKDTAEKIYEIFEKSVYNDGRFWDEKDQLIKIPKPNICEVFNYVKGELIKVKTIGPIEIIIAINEFFDFNYDYIYKKVLTPQMKQEILEDYYKNEGMHEKMNECVSIKLF